MKVGNQFHGRLVYILIFKFRGGKDLNWRITNLPSMQSKFFNMKNRRYDEKNSIVPIPAYLMDDNLINRVHYELKKPTAEISLLNQEEPIKISEVGGAENGSRLTFVTWTKESSLLLR